MNGHSQYNSAKGKIMKLYNTLTRTVDEFVPRDPKDVKMYTCGPTVYHFAHIGNLRSYIMEDVLEKALNYVGFHVTRAMNITDVGHLSGDSDDGEDKMLKGAEREHKTVMEIAKFYTDAFRRDCDALNIKWPEIVVPATSCIDTYIKMIEVLLEKGYAYQSNGNVYFDVSKLKEYYVLSNQNTEDLVVGAREGVSDDEGKKNPQDFALWFTKSKFENHALKWQSPWGEGYPGWHIECSGISYKYLGEYLDLHCGGVDNKFPHHTNEIAQSESFLGHKWCTHWFHVQHLNLADGKMSKSKGEFITVDSLKEKGYAPEVYRLFCLQSHYRRVLMFSYSGLDAAKGAYNSLAKQIGALKQDDSPLESEKMKEFDDKFRAALENDLNTSLAVTCVFDTLKSDMNDNSKIELLKRFDTVLGLSFEKMMNKSQNVEVDKDFEQYILSKIEERKQAKLEKDYAKSDAIRDELKQKGVTLIDTKEGTTYKLD